MIGAKVVVFALGLGDEAVEGVVSDETGALAFHVHMYRNGSRGGMPIRVSVGDTETDRRRRQGETRQRERERGRRSALFLPSINNESIFPRDNRTAHHSLALGNETPSHWPKRLIQFPPILDLREIENPIRLDFNISHVEGRHEVLELLLRDGLGRNAVETVCPVRGEGRATVGGLRLCAIIGVVVDHGQGVIDS